MFYVQPLNMVKQHPHRKVNEQTNDVVQGGNERARCECRIDVVTVEHQRDQRSEGRSKEDHGKD